MAPGDALHAELAAHKEAGNAAFRAGSDREAFRRYTAGIARALQAGLVDLDAAEGWDATVQLAATLYANRAAAGLRLGRHEQVVADSWRAQALMQLKGYSENVVPVAEHMHPVLSKLRARRAGASVAMGSVLAAQREYNMLLGRGDTTHARDARVLGECHLPPIRWGQLGMHPDAGRLPPAPPKRCSAAVDGVVARVLSCRLPKASLFMQCAAWGGRLWFFGGGEATPMDPNPSGDLLALDPATGTLAVQRVLGDAAAARLRGPRASPAPRQRHSMVLWRDALYIWGGASSDFTSSDGGRAVEGTLWRVDLRAQPLRWQRLRCSGPALPAPRCSHSAVVWRDSMVVYGGEGLQDRRQELGDVWALDLNHLTWRRLKDAPAVRRPPAPAAAPQPRTEHCAWAWGDWMYVFGGASNNVEDEHGRRDAQHDVHALTFSELWRLHLLERRWERVHAVGCVPGPLTEAGVAFDAKTGAAYICGGYSTSGFMTVARNAVLRSTYSAEGWQFSCAGHWWRRVARDGGQPALGGAGAGACAAVLDGKLFVAGGYMCEGPEPWPLRSITSIDTRVCAHCGVHKDRAPGGRLQQCSACKEAGRAPTYFCSQACSEAAWPTHKILCKGLLP